MHYLPNTWGLNQISKHVWVQVKPFSFTLPKKRIFGTICSLQLVWKFGHFLPVFGPYAYLEFFSSFLLVISASLKYIVDIKNFVL